MSKTRQPTIQTFENAEQLYNVARQPSKKKELIPQPFIENLNSANVLARITHLREADYTETFTSKDGKKILIKYHSKEAKEAPTPIHPHEAEIQALRYLNGMLLIQKNWGTSNEALFNNIRKVFRDYEATIPKTAEDTHKLAEKFATILQEEFLKKGVKLDRAKAQKQVTMARDLGIMLEDHPAICTISETVERKAGKEELKVAVEQAELVRVGKAYYSEVTDNLNNQVWFQSALKYAGVSNDSWIKNFFANKEQLNALAEKGVPAPPSARWLPLPANNQLVKTEVFDTNSYGQLSNGKSSIFIRMGITTAFQIKDVKEQEKLAKMQLKEIIRSQLKASIDAYNNKYESVTSNLPSIASSKPVFYVSYQTLLTPHYLESSFYSVLKDNNAKFVEMAKEAMDSVQKEVAKDPDYAGIELRFAQTNSAVNKRAQWLSAKKIGNDQTIQQRKLEETAALFETAKIQQLLGNTSGITTEMLDQLALITNFIKNGAKNPDYVKDIQTSVAAIAGALEKTVSNVKEDPSAGLEQELATRLQAAVQLRMCMDKHGPFAKLNAYERNIMKAALEKLTLDSQALTLLGCKSARDRTAIVAAAIRIMLENPQAMGDWEVLSKGISKTLEQGHHFHAMSYHTAIVKIGDVHEKFMKKMSETTQSSIESLKRFSKTLGTLSASESKIFAKKRQPEEQSKKDAVKSDEKGQPHP